VRASRLLALLIWLQERGGRATAPELAAELEVSVRTVYRDVAALQTAGVPLWTETGPQGGVRLLDGWRTRLDGLSGDEASSLFLAGAGSAAAELGLGTILVSAQTKLLATLPPELRGRAGRVRERFLLDAPHWFHRDEPLDALPVLADALWREARVEISYRRGDRVVTRHVEPLGLVLKAGVWYVVARVDSVRTKPGRARTRGTARPEGASGVDMRTYRVGRIESAVATGERFERPAGFVLARWWAASEAEFNAEILHDRVRIRLSPRAQSRLPHVTDTAAANAALDAVATADTDGWKTVDLAVESEAVALSQLVALGGDVEVLEPRSLRASLARAGDEIARRNRAAP
jgi:predicted DNA-binding transcriptional regulator YafY